MLSRPFFRAVLVGAGAALIILLVVLALRGTEDPKPPEGFDPRSLTGQEPALDAPYVPTEHVIVERMLEMGDVGPDDFVIDLGSGDGRILIAAAKEHGARGLGVDIDPARIRDSRINARAAGVEDQVEFRQQDLFRTPIAPADVLTLYLTPEINLQLRPRILSEMRPGTRVVSHAFDMGEWRWDERALVESANVYMWIVPADVEGAWTLTAGGTEARLDLEQEFDNLEGTVTIGDRTSPISEGEVSGETIRFVADLGGGRRLFRGRVVDGRIEQLSGASSDLGVPLATDWRAVRAG